MIPPLIVEEALSRGIDLIAITDHNASANVASVIAAAQYTSLKVLPGLELQTREEVHTLCIFDTLDQLQLFMQQVDSTLPVLQNKPEYFGPQYIVDSTGDLIREENRLLLTSSTFSLEEACARVIELGGIFIPAHIDRKSNGLMATLGFIPPDLRSSAMEISRLTSPSQVISVFPQLASYPLIQSGDVHRLNEFLAPNLLTMESPTIEELKLAFQQKAGRRLEIRSQL
jgi:3',5'-nucleoside bisphosphate phosphatase